MKFIKITLISILLSLSAQGQNLLRWTRPLDTSPDSAALFPEKTIVTDSGFVYALSSYRKIVGMSFIAKIYLTKFEDNGDIIWQMIFDNNGIGEPRGFDMVTDLSGNCYIAGGLMGSMNFSPFVLAVTPDGNFSWKLDVFDSIPNGYFNQIKLLNSSLYLSGTGGIAKVSTNGFEVWSKPIGVESMTVDGLGRMIISTFQSVANLQRFNTDGTINFFDSTIVARRIVTDYYNNIYLLSDFGQYELVKYDSSGMFIWSETDFPQAPPFGDIGYEVLVDYNLDVYAVGLSDTIFKFDRSGNLLWRKSMNGMDSYLVSAQLYSSSFLVVAGSFLDSVASNVRVSIYNSIGFEFWKAEYNSNNTQEFAKDLAVNTSGIFLLEDSMSSTNLISFESPFDFGAVNFDLICVDSVWYDTLDPTFINVRIFNGDVNHLNYPSVQIVSPLGDTIGNPSNNVTFFAHGGNIMQVYQDTITEQGITDFSGYTFLMSEGFGDTTVAIYNCSTLSVNDADAGQLSIFPNPVHDVLHLRLIGKNGKLELFNMAGQKCLDKTISAGESISVGHLSPGIYFGRYMNEKGASNFRIVKE